ncbi:MAG: tripartite tricarboxylate transporter TctB family protein [Kiloniellales bacterium]
MNDETSEKQHHRKAIGADLVLPIMAAVYAVYYLNSTSGFPWEARISGTFIAIAIWSLVGIMLMRTALRLKRGEATLRMTALLRPAEKMPMRLGFIALTALNIWLLDWTGFTLAVILFLATSMWLLGVRGRKSLVLIPLLAGGIGYFFFIVLLDTRLPKGPVEHALQWIF